MKKELEEKLYEDFPQLFRDRNEPINRSLMLYGCDCGNGWYNLIYETCEKLMANNPEGCFRVVFVQIKEKFGGLRIYIRNGTDELYNILQETENKSYTICEMCGSEENVYLNKEGWITSLCPACHETRDERRLPCVY